MIAYNKNWLYNRFVNTQAEEALQAAYINQQEATNINARYTPGFYTPNVFIRIGLFILTLIITFFSLGLISLFLMEGLEKAIAGIAIFFGLLTYAMLEFMIRSKHHYKSGVDDALTFMAAGLFFGGLSYGLDASALGMSCIAFIISLLLTLRFTDRFMSLSCFISLCSIAFFACSEMGGLAKALVPFVLMMISAAAYFFAKVSKQKDFYINYFSCLTIIEIASLLCFFIAGNYYVVRELSIAMFNLELPEGASIPFGKLFWAFTILTPIAYIFFGVKTKNTILIRCGLLVGAAMIFTIHYYYHLTPVEVFMTFGGIILIGCCYFLTRYLKIPKHGYTYEDISSMNKIAGLQAESLTVTETFAPPQAIDAGIQFGGGSFGGGGAGSQF